MWLAVLTMSLLLGVVSDHVLGAPTSSRLDDDETRSFWKGWLLLDDPLLTAEEGGRRKGQITPKSVFIAPVIRDLPDCAPGYKADEMGRCHRIVTIDRTAQLSFLLQKLNAMYATSDKLTGGKRTSNSSTTEGPLKVAIPLVLPTEMPSTIPTTTESPTNTEKAELVVVAAEVQLKDSQEHSTSIPGAIVTLWHLNKAEDDEIASSGTETTTMSVTQTVTQATTTLQPETTTVPSLPLGESTTTTEDYTSTDVTSQQLGDTDVTSSAETQSTQLSTVDFESATNNAGEASETTSDDAFLPEVFLSTVDETQPTSIFTTNAPKTTSESPSPPPPLSVNKADSDIKTIDSSSDLSSENTFEDPNVVHKLTEASSAEGYTNYPTVTDDRIYFPTDFRPNPTPFDEGVQPSHRNRLRWPPYEDTSSVQTSSQYPYSSSSSRPENPNWSWGNWQGTSQFPTTTARPLYYNFWSHVPRVPDPEIKTRTGLHSQPTRFPTTFNGRPSPLYYQELTGQDVANVFHNSRQPWHQRS